MTPEREKYLAKCSKKELVIRCKISEAKSNLAYYKDFLTRNIDDWGLMVCKQCVDKYKLELTAYRHELQRSKGMGRVVVPKRIFIDNYCGISTKCTCCKCGRLIPHFENYCSDCGRHILWEKVK